MFEFVDKQYSKSGLEVALVTNSEADRTEFSRIFKEIGHNCTNYSPDQWSELLENCDKYQAVLIDLNFGGGLMALEICKQLLMRAYEGNIILLAGGSMKLYQQRYAIVRMKDNVKRNPVSVFDRKGASELDVMADTVFMTDYITKEAISG